MEDIRKLIQKPRRKQLSSTHNLLHQNFVKYGANAKGWMRKCVLLLPEIEKGRIWEKKGFGSIYEYAAKLAGMNRDTVNNALRILKKIEDKPEIREVVEVRGINIVKPIVTVLTKENAGFWAEKAMTMSKNTLETFVREIKKAGDDDEEMTGLFGGDERELELPGPSGTVEKPHKQAIGGLGCATSGVIASSAKQSPKVTIGMQIDADVADQLQKLKGNGDWNELMKELLNLRKEKLEKEKPEAVEATSRHIPAKIHKHVLFRTNEICSFPGCTKPFKILHHSQRFSLENTHDPNRIEPLCKAHERLVHAGLIAGEDGPVQNWKIRKQPDKTDERFLVDEVVAKYRKPE